MPRLFSIFAAMVLVLSSATSSVTVAQQKPSTERTIFPDPVEQQIEGWTVEIDPRLLEDAQGDVRRSAMSALGNHLQRVVWIVSPERLVGLRTVKIRLDLQHPTLKSMQYHPSRQWLIDNGHDPRLERHVHIPDARNLYALQTWAKHPYCILHELAHAYHDQILGFDHAEVKAAYDAAKDSGILKNVLLFTGSRVDHYGLSNHKEYFAESTEAYFGVNDFYPFVRAELKEHDPRMFETLEKLWGPVP